MPTWRPFDWYEHDPLYYDIVFDADTAKEAAFLEAVHARHGAGGRRMLEPACGSGRLVLAMARAGYDVTGFDVSPAMLRFARRRLEDAGVRARVARGRMESFSFARPFDIAHCLVSTFRYLLDEASAAAHLACVAAALRPGGVYVLGLHVCDYDQAGCARERWTADRDGVGVVCNIQSWPPDRRTRMERVRSRLVVDRGGRVERFETHWTFRTYSVRQLRALIRSEPRLEHVATYDFGYDVDRPVELDGSCIDYVLVLRRAG